MCKCDHRSSPGRCKAKGDHTHLSVSVLLVLMEMLRKNYNGIFLMSALGPGFTAGLTGIKIS